MMSILLRNVPEDLNLYLEEKAKDKGISKNALALSLLEKMRASEQTENEKLLMRIVEQNTLALNAIQSFLVNENGRNHIQE